MTDLEMVKLCAQAIGITIADDGRPKYWPLTDKAQCFKLVERFYLDTSYLEIGKCWLAQHPIGSPYASNPDLSRAIVTCVAKMELRKAEGR